MSKDSSKGVFVQVPLILLASSLVISAAEMKTVDDFRAAAAKANAVLTIPDWEKRSGQGNFQEHCCRSR